MNWIKKLALVSRDALVFMLIGFVTLEFLAFVLSSYNLLPYNDTPQIYLGSKRHIPLNQWRTENSEWGAWHISNGAAKASSSCFDVEYTSNEVGARDNSFLNLPLKNNYVLIGDSFAEGWGVNLSDTAQYLIEKKTHSNVLNFGSANNLGPVQYYIVYNKLAKQYPHDGLIIFFLPDNDFTDNDIKSWKSSKRFRPYYQKISENEYVTFIPKDSIKKKQDVSTHLGNYLWLNNVYKTYRLVYTSRKISNEHSLYSGYFDASMEQQKGAIYFIDKLISETNAKDIILVSIPRKQDFMRIAEGADKNWVFWHKAFETSGVRLKKSVTFIDLADYANPQHVDDLFLACDGHWSIKGNKWAADIIASKLK